MLTIPKILNVLFFYRNIVSLTMLWTTKLSIIKECMLKKVIKNQWKKSSKK